MAHDYNIRIGATALVPTYASAAILYEGVAARRSEHVDIAYLDGTYVAPRPFTAERLARLRTVLGDGTPTEIYTAWHGIKSLLMPSTDPYLTKNDPLYGDVRALIRVDEPVEQQGDVSRFTWDWPVWIRRGHWETVAATTEVDNGLTTTGTIGPLTISGDHPTYPIIQISCQSAGSNPAVEDQTTGDRLSLPSAFSTSDVIVIDCVDRTVLLNGTRAPNLLDINRGWWMRWDAPGTVTLDWTATSGTWNVSTSWRSRIR